MHENRKIDLDSQDLNLNLLSLDNFEQLPQKNQNENETGNLKKKEKKKNKYREKKSSSSTSLDDNFSIKVSSFAAVETASEASITPNNPNNSNNQNNRSNQNIPNIPNIQNNHDVNVATIKKNGETVMLPPFRPSKEKAQQNIQLYPPIGHPQMNGPNFQTPIFYPHPVYPHMKRPQHPVFYFSKEPIQLKREKAQPLPIINPQNRKQIEIEQPNFVPRERTHNKPQRLYNPNRPKKQEPKEVIYRIPELMKIETSYVPMFFPTTESWFDHLNSTSISSLRTHENNFCIAIDCEMVGIGEKGKYSSLARVSIVNYYGEVLLDKFVKPTREITDYRTKFSGITPELLANANEFKKVQKEVESIMKDHIVVGQSIYFDFKALRTRHPEHLIRDTSQYNMILGAETEKGVTPSLKKLAKDVLRINIQEGEHDSIEDARASMILYRHRQAEWEEYLKTNGFPKPKGCKICDSFSHVIRDCPYNRKNLKNAKKDKKYNQNLSNDNIINDNDDKIDYDEYNRDPNTSKYYSYRCPESCNNYNSFTRSSYQHYNYHAINNI
ncbi:hypothetical protein C1645_834293 [Glomus cerebriforme]|uniref:RNA exonuclease 4 n=1 Tax=Glomus cerebriforme TaxID=658196 RepID=A0A397S9X1_9GLOM|nr:hypothetical protein C1645_834293 [Glomus cerebriforme]